MIFCQYCGWMASKSPPRCAHCPAITDSVIKQKNLQISLKIEPVSHATSESFQEMLTVSPSDTPEPNSRPASLENEPTGSKLQPQSQNSPVSSNSVSLQPADRCPTAFPVNYYLTLTSEKTPRSQTSSLSSQLHGSDQEIQILHPCRFCKLTFTASYLLHHHIKARHKHRCNMCPRTFHGGLKLAQHQAYAHLVSRPCNVIGATFSNPGPARTTNSSSIRKTRKPYTSSKQSLVCQACSRNFHSPGTIQKHRCNPQHVQCTSCGKYFGSKILLRQHSNQNNCNSAWRKSEETETKDVSPLVNLVSPQRDNPVSDSQNSDSSNLLPQKDS
ncbi:zinc finger protein 350-like [Osmerus eperlanus]|uniref:zinc finger protein 350-like n=1 Tax=Osmerus eperlanus TaxID=29151 RepID=UPI002E12C53F